MSPDEEGGDGKRFLDFITGWIDRPHLDVDARLKALPAVIRGAGEYFLPSGLDGSDVRRRNRSFADFRRIAPSGVFGRYS